MKQYRQGDILLIPMRELAPGEASSLLLSPRKSDSLILALGEGTGHAHVLEAVVYAPAVSNDAPAFGTPQFSDGARSEIAVLWPGTLKHVSIRGEAVDHPHADQEIEAGWYEVRTQLPEYKPAPRARNLDYD